MAIVYGGASKTTPQVIRGQITRAIPFVQNLNKIQDSIRCHQLWTNYDGASHSVILMFTNNPFAEHYHPP